MPTRLRLPASARTCSSGASSGDAREPTDLCGEEPPCVHLLATEKSQRRVGFGAAVDSRCRRSPGCQQAPRTAGRRAHGEPCSRARWRSWHGSDAPPAGARHKGTPAEHRREPEAKPPPRSTPTTGSRFASSCSNDTAEFSRLVARGHLAAACAAPLSARYSGQTVTAGRLSASAGGRTLKVTPRAGQAACYWRRQQPHRSRRSGGVRRLSGLKIKWSLNVVDQVQVILGIPIWFRR